MKFIKNFKSPSYDERNCSNIKFVIIHYTALKNTKVALDHLCDKKNKVSSHFLISQNGSIYNLVSEKKRAWHAGKCKWKNYKNLNSLSIGIELDYSYEFKNNKYKNKLLVSLKFLLKYLINKYKIKKTNILGHSDIAPLRKIDPGPTFPWSKLLSSNLVFNPQFNNDLLLIIFNKWLKTNGYNSKFKTSLLILKCIGYDVDKAIKNKNNLEKIILAYQSHYIQSNVTGKIDKNTITHMKKHYLKLLLTKN